MINALLFWEVSDIVTRKDIAEKAGVSVSVVSRALNNSGYVEEQKKQLIVELAKEMGYKPNPVALSLGNKKTKQILFFCRDMRNAYNIQLYEGMSAEARKHGYMISLTDSLDYKEIKNLLVDGLILVNEEIAEEYLREAGKNYLLPVVVVSYGIQLSFSRSIPRVECNLLTGTEKMLEYLWSMGHQKIAFLAPFKVSACGPRYSAWKNFMSAVVGPDYEKYSIDASYATEQTGGVWRHPFPEDLEENYHYTPEHYFERGRHGADVFHKKKCDATVVFCFNDEMAIGFYQRLTELGYRVPEDISIAGMDNNYALRYASKRITTLDIYPKDHGALCVRVLLDIIENNKVKKHFTEIESEIVEGETVRRIRT